MAIAEGRLAVAGKSQVAKARKVGGAGAPPEPFGIGEAVPRVERVEKAGPTHARELHHLVGLGMSIRQGEPCSAMRLDFELSCGVARIRACDHDLEVTLRLCHIGLERVNCEVKPHSHYEHRLSDGAFESDRTDTHVSERSREANIGLEAGLSAGLANPSFAAKLGALWKRGNKGSDKQQETTRRQPRVDLIVTSGQDRWQVGDARLGDARNADGRLLGSYFGEVRDRDGDPHPLCIIAQIEPTQPVELTVAATVPVGQLTVAIADGPLTEEIEAAAVSVVRRGSAKAKRDHAARRAELRSRVAGIVAGKALADNQRQAGLPVPEGECILALQTLVVPPAVKSQAGAGAQ